MLLHFLYPLHESWGALNIFKYITFRASLGFIIAFLFVLAFEPVFIRRLQRRGVKGQPIRDDGPATHEVKQGTPTMGGLVMVGAVSLSTLLLADLTNPYVLVSMLILWGYAALGFVDDYRKISKQDTAGLSGKTKLLWQFLLAAIAAVILLYVGMSSDLRFPFFKDLSLPLGLFFIPFVCIVIVGTSNATNLTDGLDGLAIGPIMTVGLTYAVISYLTGHFELSEYLTIPYVRGAGELTVVLASLVAAGLGFLWYNTYPAQVFMGDVGALSLGGVLGVAAVVVKHELLLIIAGGVFVVEALSVIIQRYYYKATKKRFFKMAPIHHHFELMGWPEPKVIVRFWIVSIVLALIALATLKVR